MSRSDWLKSLQGLCKGLLLSQGFVATRGALGHVAPENLPDPDARCTRPTDTGRSAKASGGRPAGMAHSRGACPS